MRKLFLMDTNIVSYMGDKKQRPGLRPWLLDIGKNNLAICYPIIAELLRGAYLLKPDNPSKAAEILTWVENIRQTNFPVLPMNLDVADVYAKMTSTPRLKQMWISDGKSKRNRLGHDLMIAAVSIVHRTPIITENVDDFLSIDRSFPLPGVYHPNESTWYVAPTVDRQIPVFDHSRPDPQVLRLPRM